MSFLSVYLLIAFVALLVFELPLHKKFLRERFEWKAQWTWKDSVICVISALTWPLNIVAYYNLFGGKK